MSRLTRIGAPLVIAISAGAALWMRHHEDEKPIRMTFSSVARPVNSGARAQTKTPVVPSLPLVNTTSQSLTADRQEAWKKFQERFGADLRPELTIDGRLATVRGPRVGGIPAAGSFDPKSPQQALARAREIVAAAGDLIGYDPSSPLNEGIAHGSESSARVAFHELRDDTQIAPAGDVVVDLGPSGELLALYSRYVPSIDGTLSAAMTEDSARALAAEAFGEGARVEGGSQVMWVPHAPNAGGATQAHPTYEYWSMGRQILVDATNGHIVSDRDRRRF